MNYFDYQPKVPMGRVWSLFTKLGELSEEEKLGVGSHSCDYTHTLDIVNAALSGSISTTPENLGNFNLKAYEIQCAKNDKINFSKQVEKLLYIVDTEDSNDEDVRVNYGDVSSRKLKAVEEAYENIDNLDSFEANINQLLNIRKGYITTQGLDLVSILVNALKGIPEAVSVLTSLLRVNTELKNLVLSLCEDGPSDVLVKELTAVV